MNEIARENRRESYIRRPLRREQILMILKNNPEGLTARQVALNLRTQDMNKARPRLTEMEQEGLVEIIGKAFDQFSGRNVSVYRITSSGENVIA